MKRLSFLFILILLIMGSCLNTSAQGDPFALAFEAFGIVLFAAVVGRFVARKMNVSLVLGEVMMGILIGTILSAMHRPGIVVIRNQNVIQQIFQRIDSNVPLDDAVTASVNASSLSPDEKDSLQEVFKEGNAENIIPMARILLLFSSFGIALLLFSVGLQSNILEIIRLGPQAVLVAALGIAGSGVLGYFVTFLVFPGADPRLPLFIGGALCSSSTGITARVFKEMNKMDMPEAKMVMSAAVFDDILGLVLLAILSGVVSSGSLQFGPVLILLFKAVAFLGAVVLTGLYIMPKIIKPIEKLDPQNIRLLFPIILLLLMCWLADYIGLAMTIGAFAAGLMITEKLFASTEDLHHTVEKLIAPIEGIFVPVFFVLMGVQVDITLLADFKVIGIGLLITVVAILGKLGAGIFLPKHLSRLVIGIALIPRAEVALIFMSIGKSVGVINAQFYAIIVMVIMLTISFTPPALRWAFGRSRFTS
jgi:Kef-type K+ transport system membrane component KefB